MNTEVKKIRLAGHQLSQQTYRSARELIAWMGAMQAQDFGMAKWAIAIRLKQCTEQDIEDAFNRGDFIRTHIMRPTWHFVASEDVRWLLKLTGERIKGAWKYVKDLKVDEQEITKCYNLLERTLRDNNYQTKAEITKIFEQEGLGATERHMYLFTMLAEADGIICSGALKNKKQTYALLDERVADQKQIHKDEALARLAQRYMKSHSPAALQDFVWWSGLTIGDCRHALALIGNELIKDHFKSSELYIHESCQACSPPVKDIFHLLSAYDEYIISYKTRTNVLDLEHHPKAFNKYGIFQPVVLYNGHAVGNWKKRNKSDIDITFWDTNFSFDKELLAQAEIKYHNYKNQ